MGVRVELIAHTTAPTAVCNLAARTCTSEGIPPLRQDDDKGAGPLRAAMASGHESVAEHATFTFAIEGISRACSHQLVRHRIGASYSQQSQRYVNMDDFEYVTPESIKKHQKVTHVDSGYEGDHRTYKWSYNDHYSKSMNYARGLYKRMIEAGIPEEDARYILPNACTTNIVVTMNARELRHFFALRCCNRAQWEIRELAEAMLQQVRDVAPVLFADAGPRCGGLGYCPESDGCGRMPRREVDA